MTCSHCCDANKIFDSKNAIKQLKTFRKKGPKGTTRKMIALMDKIKNGEKKMLDIGAGIGILQWHFLEKGGESTTNVDASAGYLEQAKNYAKEKGWEEKVKFLEGDFNDLVDEIDSSEIVTLDKVICCYPDYQLILKNSLLKAEKYIMLSYPISNWISKSLNKFTSLFFWIKKSHFKTYIHPNKKVRELISSGNFKLLDKTSSFPWIIEVYQRN